MSSGTDGSIVAVARCADSPVPFVPAVVVVCIGCGADCWLSARTGASTIATAAKYGDASIVCLPCLLEKVAEGMTFEVAVTRDVVNEARGANN